MQGQLLIERLPGPSAGDSDGLEPQRVGVLFCCKLYNNSAAVPESGAMFKEWLVRSEKVRADHPEHLDLAYGPRPRDKIDYFSAGQDTPVLVFIHGGFWQMRSKNDFAFLAESFLSSGISVAMVGYPLGPDVTMDEIVADTHAAIRYLAAELPKLGGDPRRVVVSGWSSGGHLATMVLDEPSLRAGLSISGIFELEPLVTCRRARSSSICSRGARSCRRCAGRPPTMRARGARRPCRCSTQRFRARTTTPSCTA